METVLAWVGYLCPVLQAVEVAVGRGLIDSCSWGWVYETRAAVRGHQGPLSDTFQGYRFQERASELQSKEPRLTPTLGHQAPRGVELASWVRAFITIPGEVWKEVLCRAKQTC